MGSKATRATRQQATQENKAQGQQEKQGSRATEQPGQQGNRGTRPTRQQGQQGNQGNKATRQRVLSSSEVRASDLEHRGSWVRIPSGAQIFSVSSYG